MSAGQFRLLCFSLGALLLLCAVALWTSLPKPRRNLPPSVTEEAFRLSPVSFAELPGWRNTNPQAALAAFRRSCGVISRQPSGASIGGAGYAGKVADWTAICARAPDGPATATRARMFFESEFAPVRVAPLDGREPLFTGYYEPVIQASRLRHGRFQQPVYGPPANLVSVELQLFRAGLPNEQLHGCISENRVWPCPTRAEIDRYGLPLAKPLLYAADPVALFFLQVQGSGRAALEDGTLIRLAYAGQNGRPYTPIGRTLIDKGLLARRNLSMQAIRDWLAAHRSLAEEIMETNQSYIFFKEMPIGDPVLGSAGTEDVPLTPRASAAVDARIHPLGVPVYLSGARPGVGSGTDGSFGRLLITQDTGGAIRGPVRADLFWGSGAEAENIAGRMKSTGSFFILLPKNVARALPAREWKAW